MRGLARTEPRPEQGHAEVRFCTHCGTLSPEHGRRVCESCGLGVVLACAPGLLTRTDAAFLVVTSDLRISAASAAAERVVGEVSGEPLLDVFSGDPALPRWIGRAAMGSRRVATVALRCGTRRIDARIGACGDPPAALVVLNG